MQRRHFVKLSATTTAALLFSRITHAAGNGVAMINVPEEVWAQSGDEWHQLKSLIGSYYSYKDLHVELKANGDSLAVYVQSPTMALQAVRLKWKHLVSSGTKCLGDHWERSYGDLSWKAPEAGTKNPWYVLLLDDRHTACFGVKTGCNAICWWGVKSDSIELTLDTRSGGAGVHLGARKLHAADIITTGSREPENAFATSRRFCKMMCSTPRLPKQPVYGINDWYFAYGNNSAALIKESTAIMAELVTDTTNRPFSVVDAGWAQYSPLLPGDAGWNEDFSKPNDKFKDMHLLADDIKKLGMRPGLWTRPLCGRHDEKANLLAPKIPGRDDPKNPVLDPTIPENLERIKNYMEVYRQWGYHLVKHDYSTYDIFGRWGFEMKDSLTVPVPRSSTICTAP
jgi:alpha-galactosidase